MSKPSKRRRTTITGRVVYDRTPHLFNDNDLARIFRGILANQPGDEIGKGVLLITMLFEVLKSIVGGKLNGINSDRDYRRILRESIRGAVSVFSGSIERANELALVSAQLAAGDTAAATTIKEDS